MHRRCVRGKPTGSSGDTVTTCRAPETNGTLWYRIGSRRWQHLVGRHCNLAGRRVAKWRLPSCEFGLTLNSQSIETMRFRKFATLIVLLAFGASTTELGTTASTWLKPTVAGKTSACSLHSFKCQCPEVCKVQKPKAGASCHDAAKKSVSKTEPSSSASCALKARCGQKDAVAQATSSLKDSWLQPFQHLQYAVEEPLSTSSLVGSPRRGFLPASFHPPRNT